LLSSSTRLIKYSIYWLLYEIRTTRNLLRVNYVKAVLMSPVINNQVVQFADGDFANVQQVLVASNPLKSPTLELLRKTVKTNIL
jgi:hypothetical protein